MEQINFQIKEKMHQMIQEEARKKGETQSEFIRRAIRERLQRIISGQEKI